MGQPGPPCLTRIQMYQSIKINPTQLMEVWSKHNQFQVFRFYLFFMQVFWFYLSVIIVRQNFKAWRFKRQTVQIGLDMQVDPNPTHLDGLRWLIIRFNLTQSVLLRVILSNP